MDGIVPSSLSLLGATATTTTRRGNVVSTSRVSRNHTTVTHHDAYCNHITATYHDTNHTTITSASSSHRRTQPGCLVLALLLFLVLVRTNTTTTTTTSRQYHQHCQQRQYHHQQQQQKQASSQHVVGSSDGCGQGLCPHVGHYIGGEPGLCPQVWVRLRVNGGHGVGGDRTVAFHLWQGGSLAPSPPDASSVRWHFDSRYGCHYGGF